MTAPAPSSDAPFPRPALTRVFPGPATSVTVREAYDVARPLGSGVGGATRPWVGVCMVASLDGSVTLDGASGGLGNTNDLEVLLTLRDLADAVIVGLGTARGEGYGAPGSGIRIGVVTNTGNIDPSSELFRSGAGFVITTERTEIPSHVDVVRAGIDRVDLAVALDRIGAVVPGVAHVHVEGGPSLNAALLEHDLVDELDLTIAPLMVGGMGKRAALGAGEVTRRFDLAHLLVDDDSYTFARWVRHTLRETPNTPERLNADGIGRRL